MNDVEQRLTPRQSWEVQRRCVMEGARRRFDRENPRWLSCPADIDVGYWNTYLLGQRIKAKRAKVAEELAEWEAAHPMPAPVGWEMPEGVPF